MDRALRDLIEAADLNGLLRAVDALCGRRAWDDLLDLADACEDAIERGKQLWPIAAHIDYRIALEGPPALAARVLHPEVARFSLGPLTEVAASTHTWEELAGHIDTPQVAAYVAQERVLRGEVLDDDERAHPEILELPGRLAAWEPAYTLPVFRADHVEVPEPFEPREPLAAVRARRAVELDEPDLVAALLETVDPWTTESNGAAAAVVVEGDGASAAAALAHPEVLIGPLTPSDAIQRIAWAAAGGGAHGRRRGGAFARSHAFYLSSLLCDLDPPIDPDELGARIGALHWYRWDEGMEEVGWVLRLAVEDRERGWGAALSATDLIEER